jgi:hypothetical protein
MFLHVTSPCKHLPDFLMPVRAFRGVMLSLPFGWLQVRVLSIGWCVE